tara:strand:+ start:873 stop:1085 length:213 start_codon:yes stop_codon:yes gene_type:complete
MEENNKGVYWYFILDVIFNLTIGLQLIIKSETITKLGFIFIGCIFLVMALKSLLTIVVKSLNDKIKQHGK